TFSTSTVSAAASKAAVPESRTVYSALKPIAMVVSSQFPAFGLRAGDVNAAGVARQVPHETGLERADPANVTESPEVFGDAGAQLRLVHGRERNRGLAEEHRLAEHRTGPERVVERVVVIRLEQHEALDIAQPAVHERARGRRCLPVLVLGIVLDAARALGRQNADVLAVAVLRHLQAAQIVMDVAQVRNRQVRV